MPTPSSFNKFCLWLSTCTTAVVMATAGCSGDAGPDRSSVSGTVTFQGQPVAAGTITFDPDTTKQSPGPQGFAVIENGKFDTRATGKGTVGGPHIVRIVGEVGPDPAKEGNVLYIDHRIELDLPQESYQTEIEIPPSSVRSLPKKPVV